METDKYKIGFIASGKKQIQNALATIQDESVEFRVVRAGLDEAIPIGKNILFTAFRGEKEGLEILEELIKRRILPGNFDDSYSMEQSVIWGKKQGCQVVVGGGRALRQAGS